MKKTLFLSFFFFFILSTFSQDTIFKRNKDTVLAKITEITPLEIKYKKFSFQEGPSYIDRKSEVKMIVFANGMKETFEEEKSQLAIQNNINKAIELNNKIDDHKMYYIYHNYKINQPQMQSILMQTNDKAIMNLVSDAKKARRREAIFIATFPLIIGGGVLISEGVSSYYGDPEIFYAFGGFCVIAGVACPIISIYNKVKKMNCNSEAIKLYNQKY